MGSDFRVQVAFSKQSSQVFLWDPGEHWGPGSEQRPQGPRPMHSRGEPSQVKPFLAHL